jgi:hypothetical protein
VIGKQALMEEERWRRSKRLVEALEDFLPCYSRGGGVWESNPPTGGLTRSTGFEVQGPHQQPNASSAGILTTYTMVVKVNFVHRARKCARQLAGNVLQIRRGHDVVAVEDHTGLMASDLHRDTLRHTHVDHIPDRSPPEVVPQYTTATSLHTRGSPDSFEIVDTLALVQAS